MKFKRSLAALIAAVMAIGMVSCGIFDKADDDDDDDDDETTSSVSAKDDDADEKEEKDDDKSDEEPGAEEEESKADEEPAPDDTGDSGEETVAVDPTYENGVFTNGKYEMTVDGSKWEFSSGFGLDGQFTYIGSTENEMYATATFNVVSLSGSIYAGLTAEDYAAEIDATYDSMDGASIIETGEQDFYGYNAFVVKARYEIMEDYNMDMYQVILTDDKDSLVVISYGALDEVMGDLEPEFDEVLSTFRFI